MTSHAASEPMNKARLKIGQLAKEAGLTPDSVRFYERSGLLQKPDRLVSGYRIYNESALRQLQFIKKAQALGFSLREIKQIMGLCGQGTRACPTVISIAERKLEQVQQQIDELKSFAAKLEKNLRQWRKKPSPDTCVAAEFCSLIETSCE